jgi:hypothetical protein
MDFPCGLCLGTILILVGKCDSDVHSVFSPFKVG